MSQTPYIVHDNLKVSVSQEAGQGVSDEAPVGHAFTLPEAVKIWIDSLYLSIGSQSGEKYRRKKGRFLLRGFRGVSVGVAKGFRFRWFVLSESNEAIVAGLDFGKTFQDRKSVV